MKLFQGRATVLTAGVALLAPLHALCAQVQPRTSSQPPAPGVEPTLDRIAAHKMKLFSRAESRVSHQNDVRTTVHFHPHGKHTHAKFKRHFHHRAGARSATHSGVTRNTDSHKATSSISVQHLNGSSSVSSVRRFKDPLARQAVASVSVDRAAAQRIIHAAASLRSGPDVTLGHISLQNTHSAGKSASTIITVTYGDHTCDYSGCTDRRGQDEHYGIYGQNVSGLSALGLSYIGARADMITPQQYRGEPDSKWKDTAEASIQAGHESKFFGGLLTLGGRGGIINGLAFDELDQLNKLEHSAIDGEATHVTRELHRSSKGKILIGAYESYAAEITHVTVGGVKVAGNVAQYANLGTDLTSAGVGPFISIGEGDRISLPGGPTLVPSRFSLVGGVLLDAVAYDASEPNLKPLQAHAVVGLNVALGRVILSAEVDKPLTPQARRGDIPMTHAGINLSLRF